MTSQEKYIYCKLLIAVHFKEIWCKLPEGGDNAETRRS